MAISQFSRALSATFFFREGEGYWVEAGPGGPRATTAEAKAYEERRYFADGTMVMVEADGEDVAPRSTEFVAGEPVEIAGYQGTRYTNEAGWVPVVLTDDPALLPLGRAWRIYNIAIEQGQIAEERDRSNMVDLLEERGILGIWGRELSSFELSPASASMLELPESILTLDMMLAEEADAPVSDEEGEPPNNPVLAAVHYDEALWTRQEDGTLFRWLEGSPEAQTINVPDAVSDICVAEKRLLIATGRIGNRTRVYEKVGADWHQLAELDTSRESPFFAMDCTGSDVALLTATSITMLADGTQTEIETEMLTPAGYFSTMQHDDWLYVGSNAGEWGGGLRRFSLADGSSQRIAHEDGELCGGILNTNCHPVTGLAPDPVNENCILVSVGLVHMMANGHVARICDDAVSLAYRKPITLERGWSWNAAEADMDHYGSVPFFDIFESELGAVSVGSDGIYVFGPDDASPRLRAFNRGTMWPESGIDWSHPDYIMVATTMNARHSLSGGSIILVPRQ